jgi:hypothetical protein
VGAVGIEGSGAFIVVARAVLWWAAAVQRPHRLQLRLIPRVVLSGAVADDANCDTVIKLAGSGDSAGAPCRDPPHTHLPFWQLGLAQGRRSMSLNLR